LGRLCEAIAEDDELAGEAVIDEVLDGLDTPFVRARLARAVIALRDAGRCGRLLAAVALIDLASGSRQLLGASVIEAVAVRAGVARTPAGVVLLAALRQAAWRSCGSRAAKRPSRASRSERVKVHSNGLAIWR
jgi:hypothetical protein